MESDWCSLQPPWARVERPQTAQRQTRPHGGRRRPRFPTASPAGPAAGEAMGPLRAPGARNGHTEAAPGYSQRPHQPCGGELDRDSTPDRAVPPTRARPSGAEPRAWRDASSARRRRAQCASTGRLLRGERRVLPQFSLFFGFNITLADAGSDAGQLAKAAGGCLPINTEI